MFSSVGWLTPYPFASFVRPVLSRRRSPSLFSVGFSAVGLLVLLFTASASAAQITIAWDAPRNPSLTGYRLYYGYASGSYEGAVDVGMQTTYTLADLEEGRVYFFAVAAYDANGDESEPSREITSNDPVADSEGDAAENGPTDRAEDDPAELDSEAILEDAEEIGSDENDNMNALEQDSDGDKDNDHSEARTQLHVIPQSQLKIVSVDSEPLTGDGAAESAIDGQVKTFWRTKMGAKAPVHPHELVIALGSEYEVRGFRYLSRQDGKTEGMVMRYSFYVSEDGVNWGNAVAAGTFPKDTTEKEVVFPEKMGSFVRFVAHSEVNGGPWTSMAEINILQTR